MEIKHTLAQLFHIYTLINFWLGRLIEAELPPCVFVLYAILYDKQDSTKAFSLAPTFKFV